MPVPARVGLWSKTVIAAIYIGLEEMPQVAGFTSSASGKIANTLSSRC
jgi:hypothetical protein